MRAMPRATLQELGRPSTPNCPECGSVVRRSLVPFRLRGRLLGYFPADVCANGHEYFTEESGAAIQAAAKRHGEARGTPTRSRPAGNARPAAGARGATRRP